MSEPFNEQNLDRCLSGDRPAIDAIILEIKRLKQALEDRDAAFVKSLEIILDSHERISRLKADNERLSRMVATSFMAGSRLGRSDGYDGERFDAWLKDTLDKKGLGQ